MNNVHIKEFSIKDEEWDKYLDKSFKKAVEKTKVDGFRKGKCPKNIFIKKFGIQSLFGDAVDAYINDIYTDAIKEMNVVPVCEPKIDIKAIDEKHLSLTFKLISKPEVKLGKYKDLGVKKEKSKVSAQEVKEEAAKLCSKYAELVIKENAPIVEGNVAKIDFEGYMNGEKFEGGSGTDYDLEIGSHSFIPGFEEGLIGLKTGETKELELKFPKDYYEKMAGKDVKFVVTIKEIKERVLPELNEEFFEDLGYKGIKTEEEFHKEVKKSLEEKKNNELLNKYVDDVMNEAIKNLEVEINPEIIDDEIDRELTKFDDYLKQMNITRDQYFTYANTTEEKMRKEIEPEAIKRLKSRYLIDEVVKEEKIEVSDEEASKVAEKSAERYGMTKDEFIKEFGGMEVVKYDEKVRRALKIITGEELD